MGAKVTATADAGVLAVIASVLLGGGAYMGTHLFDEHKTEDAGARWWAFSRSCLSRSACSAWAQRLRPSVHGRSR